MGLALQTFISKVGDFPLEERSLSGYAVDPDAGSPLNAQGKLARAPSIDADYLGRDAEIEEVILLGAPRVDFLHLRAIDVLSIADEELAIGPNKGRSDGDAGNGDAIYPSIGPLCRSSLVDMGEQGGYIRSARGNGDTLHQAREEDGSAGERDQR